jgi:FixJ family two-component response regulator
MDEHGDCVVAVVDDDASIRRSVRNLLLSLGFRVEAFDSAVAFLQAVQRENTGCLVLDLRMPGMDGLELLGHLAKAGQRIPTVILTAHGDEDARGKAMQAGALAFIDKPFRSAALIEAVRAALSVAKGTFRVDNE